MKKTLLYAGILFTGCVFVACNEDFDDWADPQAYAQETAADAVAATAVNAISGTLKADDLEGAVTLLSTGTIAGAEGASLIFTNLILNDNFAVPFTSQDGTLSVDPADLNAVVYDAFGSMASTARELTFKAEASVLTADGQALPADLKIGEGNSFTVNYVPPTLPAISQTSQVYYIGGYNGWNLAEPTPMDKNEDGTFSVVITIGDSEWFCFAPQEAVDAGNWDMLFRAQTNGDNSASGFFNLNSASGNSFNCEKGGKYKFTVSPKDWTYSYAAVADQLYYAGDANGWGFSPLVKNGASFEGYYYIYKADNSSTWGFKFTTTPDWNNPQYGAGEGEGTIQLDGGNCDLPSGYDSGFYKLSVNTDNLTFSLTPITVISLIGSAVNGDSSWGTDYDLTFNIDKKCWEGTFDMTDGEYKFRANHDWTISWGGADDALTTQNGANRSIEAGNYTFELYPQCDGQGVVIVTKN